MDSVALVALRAIAVGGPVVALAKREEDGDELSDDVEAGALAAMTLPVEVGPETRALIERLAGTVIVQVELGPRPAR